MTATKFLTVGAISTLVEVAVFNLVVTMLDGSAVTAKIVASLVALVNAYVGNRQWTFRDRNADGRSHELARFLVANAVCTGLGAAVIWAADVLFVRGADAAMSLVVLNVVNAASIALIVVLRFVAYHRWVFRDDRDRDRSEDAAGAFTR